MSRSVERQKQQNAAEFFSEHQQIAGFDNAGKSLFTTIRELVENSLDAAESIRMLPNISVSIEEFTEAEHNLLHGISRTKNSEACTAGDVDEEYVDDGESGGETFESKGNKRKKKDGSESALGASATKKTKIRESLDSQASSASEDLAGSQPAAAAKGKKGKGGAREATMYYTIRVKDNGCGIPADAVGNMLGKVLSGSKQGIRQTRGKFGLGAKMALIWSKKSSGLPISVTTAHLNADGRPAAAITTIILDMDIFKNTPRILSHTEVRNTEGWHGVDIGVTIAGKWSTYRQKVLQYFQQLAVITPCANLHVTFSCRRDKSKDFEVSFDRRSEQMPPVPRETLPHPRALNNVTLDNLLRASRRRSVKEFLNKDLRGVTPAVAATIAKGVGSGEVKPGSLDSRQVSWLHQELRDNQAIKDPTAECLSPAGEYNMRLGVIKELHPSMVATHTEKAGAHEGHPFVVEAAVSLGGKTVREGINVYRFANRIPLLFEVGADVVTVVATKNINWSSYHINKDSDHIGVYVSIVSTRIPFKGTSKEYIGDDVTEMHNAVKKALQSCCLQLKQHISKNLLAKEEKDRKRSFERYVPDVTNSLSKLVGKIKPRAYAHVKEDRVVSVFTSNEGDVKELLRARISQAIERFEEGAVLQAHLARPDKDKDGNITKRSPFSLWTRRYEVLDGDSLQWVSIAGSDGGLVIGLPPTNLDSDEE